MQLCHFFYHSCLLPTTKKKGQFLHNNMLQNVRKFATGDFLHCEDRADSGIEDVRMYCIASGPHKSSYRKTSYTPAIYMNIFLKAEGIRLLWTQLITLIEPISYILTLYHCSCLFSALLNLNQLHLSVCYLCELKQVPNHLLTCWKKDLCRGPSHSEWGKKLHSRVWGLGERIKTKAIFCV